MQALSRTGYERGCLTFGSSTRLDRFYASQCLLFAKNSHNTPPGSNRDLDYLVSCLYLPGNIWRYEELKTVRSLVILKRFLDVSRHGAPTSVTIAMQRFFAIDTTE